MTKAIICLFALAASCSSRVQHNSAIIQPVIITDTVPNDTDDPAIWINKADPSKSLVIGTDKDINGGLYVFDLKGRIDTARSVHGLKRPNNVDIEYGLVLQRKPVDIAVVTERYTHKLRIYSLPDMRAIDGGGIDMFTGENGDMYRDLMGVALYKNASGEIFAIVGRKSGPVDGTYLWQYQLTDGGNGIVTATLVRKFGAFSGSLEIEAIAVDDKLGYVYYCDEGAGIRKYYADPAKGNAELELFGLEEFGEDREGISIYELTDSTGYILVSDQGRNRFNIYNRQGSPHRLLKSVEVRAIHSDGSEITSLPLNETFRKGVFVVMTDEKRFHYYRPEDILE